MEDKEADIEAGKITASAITAESIEAGHIGIATWNGKTGADAKYGERHLYSDRYRERWPQDQYPEKYEADVPVD